MTNASLGGRVTRGVTRDGMTRVRVHAACPLTNLAARNRGASTDATGETVRGQQPSTGRQVGEGAWRVRRHRRGFTLIEMMLGAAILVIALVALIGAFLGQSILNAHARSLTGAMNDATRVMEQIRAQNTGAACAAAPLATVPAATGVGTCTPPLVSWDDWLQRCGGGKSLPNPLLEERVVVTCQDEAGANYCGTTQVTQGWKMQGVATSHNPIRIAVAVCWRSRGRVIGECTWNGANLVADENVVVANDTATVIDSPAMLTTLMTCRGG